jgi:arylsulfatase A-like enzyme
MHVPMIMNWPGVIRGGQVIREIGSHLDILPTVCGAAGVPPPGDRTLDGFDALPLTTGAKSKHDAIYWSSGGQLAVRRGPWKLVKNGKTFDGTPEGDKALTGDDAVFLSNLDEDPGEKTNLRHKNPQIADELSTALATWSVEVKKQ